MLSRLQVILARSLIAFCGAILLPLYTTHAESVTVTWCSPTQNIDGSALTNLAGYTIKYGPSPGSGQSTQTLPVADGRLTCALSVANCGGNNECSTVISGLMLGQRYYFSVFAYNNLNPSISSEASNEVNLVVGAVPTRTPTPTPTPAQDGGNTPQVSPTPYTPHLPTPSPTVGPGRGQPTPNPSHPADDRDGDGVVDTADNCPDVANADQDDENSDGKGNACYKRATCLDLDGDALPELLISEHAKSGQSWLHGIYTKDDEFLNLEYKKNEAPAIADYDGDGIADIATLFDVGKGFRIVYRSSGGKFDVVKTLSRAVDTALIGCDMDGDRKSDLVGIATAAQVVSIRASKTDKIVDAELDLSSQDKIVSASCARLRNKEAASLVLLISNKLKNSVYKLVVMSKAGKKLAETSIPKMPITEVVLIKNSQSKEQLIGVLSGRDRTRSKILFYRLRNALLQPVRMDPIVLKKIAEVEGMDDGSMLMLGANKMLSRMDTANVKSITNIGSLSSISTHSGSKSHLLSCVNVVPLK